MLGKKAKIRDGIKVALRAGLPQPSRASQ